MLAAFVVFVLAGISDALDGIIAKQFDAETLLGKYLDPLADKVLLVSIYITLGIQEAIPSWLVILVVSRDILIVGGILFSYLMDIQIRIKPVFVSKANTVFQIMLAALVLGTSAFDMHLTLIIMINVYVVAVSTVLSGYSYVSTWIRQSHIV